MTMSTAGEGFTQAAVVAGLIYGFAFAGRAPSVLRTVVKTAAVGLLALAAWERGDGVLLVAGLALSAVGDAVLSRDPERWLPFGLGAFLAAHLCYVALFVSLFEPGLAQSPIRWGLAIGVTLAAGGILAWLWSGLGALRWAVVAYVAAILAMVVSSLFVVSPSLSFRDPWVAFVGAAAFMASDAILAAQLFRQARLFGSMRLTNWAIWFLYFFAQLAFSTLYFIV